MTDAANGPNAAAPKKRSFFKKAAWQTSDRAEKNEDIFSHSNEFKDIVAEEKRRKREEKRIKDEKRRKSNESHERKRRKLSEEGEDVKLPSGGGSSSGRAIKDDSRARSKTPLSPNPVECSATSLGARYDSLTKSSSSTGSIPRKLSHVIDLGDSDSDLDDLYTAPPTNRPSASAKTAQAAPTQDVEEVEDPILAALKAKAREKAAKASASTPITNGPAPKSANQEAIVQLLITSDIPGTKELLVKTKTSFTLQKPREAWCQKHGLPSKEVFLTWRGQKLFDSTTVGRLGIKIDVDGVVSVEGDNDLYTDDNLPKVHVVAWTEELFQEWKKLEAKEAEAKMKAAEPPPMVEEELAEEPEPEPQQIKIRLFLKAKGKEDFKISVNPYTTIEHLTHAYRESHGIQGNQPVTLMFDGERLRPMDTIEDAGVEDLESIEVYFK